MLWYSHLFKNFSQFVVIRTVKGLSIVNEAEVDVFLELSCFFYDPVDVGNLISGSSAFSKFQLEHLKVIGLRYIFYKSIYLNIAFLASLIIFAFGWYICTFIFNIIEWLDLSLLSYYSFVFFFFPSFWHFFCSFIVHIPTCFGLVELFKYSILFLFHFFI